jgi:hypothetical protein
MQNNCTTSDRLKRFVFQRCRLLLVVNVKNKHTQWKYATFYGYETVARWAIILHTPVRNFISSYKYGYLLNKITHLFCNSSQSQWGDCDIRLFAAWNHPTNMTIPCMYPAQRWRCVTWNILRMITLELTLTDRDRDRHCYLYSSMPLSLIFRRPRTTEVTRLAFIIMSLPAPESDMLCVCIRYNA